MKYTPYNIDDFGVLILAAGDSSRMGTPKPFLMYDEKQTFLEQIIAVYENMGFKNIYLVVNQTVNDLILANQLNNGKITILVNHKPFLGRTRSIQIGLKKLKGKHVFIQNIDNPFVNTKLLHGLLDSFKEQCYINPYYQTKGGHPILLCKTIAVQIVNAPASPLNVLLSAYQKIKLNVNDPSVIQNINSPEDYAKAFK